jgi:hypothetical protein
MMALLLKILAMLKYIIFELKVLCLFLKWLSLVQMAFDAFKNFNHAKYI